MPEGLVHPKERLYFAIAMTFSVLVYLALIVTLVGLFYIPLGIAGLIVTQGVMLGRLRGNGVRVTPTQFPELYATAERIAGSMGLREVPAIYVVQEGGVLNAFALGFLGRNFMVVYSELYAISKHRGNPEIAFVIAHEMAHLVRRHTLRKALITPASFVPFLGSAYSRACEYTADAYGAYCEPAGAPGGILLLAAGNHLYRDVDGHEFVAQAERDRDFFVWLAERLSTHPTLPNRLVAIAEHMRSTAASPARSLAAVPTP